MTRSNRRGDPGLPTDSHVHSEWSWDTGGPRSAAAGRMEATCRRAVVIGLGAVVFTEHLDFDESWRTSSLDLMDHQQHMIDQENYLRPARFDQNGYLDSIELCRERFPTLQIMTGVEFGQPHLHEERAEESVDFTTIERVLGSVHTVPVGNDRYEPNTLYRMWPAERVMTTYLAEVPRMVEGSTLLHVVAHLDYAVRSWPSDEVGPFDPRRFEVEFRMALRAIARRGLALELNTRRLWPWMVQWWCEEGGLTITFGSDAHTPDQLANGFHEATLLAEHHGFGPGANLTDPWKLRTDL